MTDVAESGPLVEPGEAAGLIGASDVVVIDVRYTLGAPPQYPAFLAGHLPGAHWVDLDAELAAPPGSEGRHPLPDPAAFQSAMRRFGVRTGSTVIAYDERTSLAAARLWWLLTDGGVTCRVLNGGFAAWQRAGLPIETGPGRDIDPGDVVITPGRRERVSAEQIVAGLGGRVLVDVRTPERYAGISEPIDPVAGHIPGAINRPAGGNHDADGRFLAPAVLADRFADLDLPVFSCGSGITAAQSLLALESAGGTGSIYPGSWSGWITDPTRPVATGEHP